MVEACSTVHSEIGSGLSDGCKSLITTSTNPVQFWNDKCPDEHRRPLPNALGLNSPGRFVRSRRSKKAKKICDWRAAPNVR